MTIEAELRAISPECEKVTNLEDTISINHNWFNGGNVATVWSELGKARTAVQKELEDVRAGSTVGEWNATCESVLRASHGMNVADFSDLLYRIGRKRLEILSPNRASVAGGDGAGALDGWKLGRRHAAFDADRVRDTLRAMVEGLADNGELEVKVRQKLDDLKDTF